MEKNPSKTIGVLGGMGPSASAAFVQRILSLAQQELAAVEDDDYPHIILNSMKLRGLGASEWTEDLHTVRSQVIAGACTLERAGCDFIAIPCNTIHCFYEEISSALNVPVLNIIELTAEEARQAGCTKVGLCCSAMTAQSRTYPTACRIRGMDVLHCDDADQMMIDMLVERAMAGRIGIDEREMLETVVARLVEKGAQGVFLVCTELSLIPDVRAGVPLFDSMEVLAKESFRLACKDPCIVDLREIVTVSCPPLPLPLAA